MKTNSLYYGAPRLTNPYCRHETWSLLRDLESDKLDQDIRVQMEAELARRATRRRKVDPKANRETER
jgi:mannitol-1-phosphate/altronate dehydrogenase